MRSVIMREILGISAGLAPLVIMVLIVVLLGLGMDTLGNYLAPRVPIP